MDLISVHVPKSAGSTFGNFLTSIYGVDQVYKDYDDYPMNPLSRFHQDPQGWRVSADEEVERIGPGFRAIHGHFAIEKYAQVFPEARRIAWVRHPAAWVVSLYYFWKNGPKQHNERTHPSIRRLHSEDLSLLEFAEDPMVRNRISEVFLRGLPAEGFDFLGVQEHFDDDLQDLIQMMGWPRISAGFENRCIEPGYQEKVPTILDDPAIVERLVELNDRDMDLYLRANQIRDQRRALAQVAGTWEPRPVVMASRVA